MSRSRRSVHHSELIGHGEPKEHAPEALANETNALGHALGDDEPEDLQHRAAGEHVVEVSVPHLGVADDLLPEVGKEATRGRPAVSGNVQVPR